MDKDLSEIRRIKRVQEEICEAMRPFVAAKLTIINTAIPEITLHEGQPPKFVYSKSVQSDLDYIDRKASETRDYILKREGIVLPDKIMD
jgi:hypothetical protein